MRLGGIRLENRISGIYFGGIFAPQQRLLKLSRLQVTLFAPPCRISHWHSSGNLDYNIDRVRWNAVPGYAALHRTVQWWENWVNDTRLNLEGNEVAVADDRIDGRAEGDCHDVSLGLSILEVSSEAFN